MTESLSSIDFGFDHGSSLSIMFIGSRNYRYFEETLPGAVLDVPSGITLEPQKDVSIEEDCRIFNPNDETYTLPLIVCQLAPYLSWFIYVFFLYLCVRFQARSEKGARRKKKRERPYSNYCCGYP